MMIVLVGERVALPFVAGWSSIFSLLSAVFLRIFLVNRRMKKCSIHLRTDILAISQEPGRCSFKRPARYELLTFGPEITSRNARTIASWRNASNSSGR